MCEKLQGQQKQSITCCSMFIRVDEMSPVWLFLFAGQCSATIRSGQGFKWHSTTRQYNSLPTGSCPAGYVQYRPLNLCYEHQLEKLSYNKGVASCASRGEHFIMIDNHEKQDFIRKQIQSSTDTRGNGHFIDGSDATSEGQWVYHDGRAMTFFAWAMNYPDNATDRNILILTKSDNFRWMDGFQTATRYHMCEMDI